MTQNEQNSRPAETDPYAQSVKSQTQESGDLRAHFLIHTGEKPIQLPDPIQEHALRHK